MFGDPSLDRMVDEALAHNLDVAAAIARVEEARALAAAGARRPVVLGAGAPPARPAGGYPSARHAAAAGSPTIGDSRSIGIEAAYEADLWGRYRDASASARAALAASRYAQAVVRLSVASQVVQGYFDLRALDAQVDLTRRTLRTRNEAVSLREKRLKGGTGSALDLHQDQAEAAAAEATLADLSERASLTEVGARRAARPQSARTVRVGHRARQDHRRAGRAAGGARRAAVAAARAPPRRAAVACPARGRHRRHRRGARELPAVAVADRGLRRRERRRWPTC